MNTPPYHEFACAILVDTFGRFLFQQRDNIPGIVYPGMIHLFGGHREGTETFLQCVVRELHEELSYLVPSERFEHVVGYDRMDPGVSSRTAAHGEIFVARDLPADRLLVTEGSLAIISPDELAAIDPKLSPVAKLAIGIFLKG